MYKYQLSFFPSTCTYSNGWQIKTECNIMLCLVKIISVTVFLYVVIYEHAFTNYRLQFEV